MSHEQKAAAASRQAMIEHIATEVMGWRGPEVYESATGPVGYYLSASPRGVPIQRADAFNPFENHRQAFEALDQFPKWVTRRYSNKHMCTILDYDRGADAPSHVSVSDVSLLHAICLAACSASGYKESKS